MLVFNQKTNQVSGNDKLCHFISFGFIEPRAFGLDRSSQVLPCDSEKNNSETTTKGRPTYKQSVFCD